MKKKALYISKYIDDTTTVGYRYTNILKYASDFLDIDILDLAFNKDRFPFLSKILNKLFVYPDIYYFNLYKYKRQIKKKLFQNKFDLAIIEVQPFSFLSIASFIKKCQPGLKVIVDMNDPLTANVSYLHDNFFHRNFILWYEKRHLKNIDILIVLNEEIKNYYHQIYNFLKHIVVLEQGTNHGSFKSDVTKTNRKLELIYAGMLYKKVREPFKLYDAINKYSGGIRLSVYGSFKKKFLPPVNERYFYGGLVDKAVLQAKFSDADVIIFIDNFFGLQIPGKILEILDSDKPILFIYEKDKSPTLKYIKDYEGVYISKNDSEEILKQLEIIALMKNRKFNRDLTKYYWVNLIKNIFLSNPDILNFN
jgi:hypothetical protein